MSSFVFGQKNNILKAKIINKNTKIAIENASVYLIQKSDTSIVKYSKSKENGTFLIKVKNVEKKLLLKITSIGYENYNKEIDFDTPNIDLETIELSEKSNLLIEVVIKNIIAPIKIKKDTLQFNAKSFKTPENSNVAYLLKKIPGISINSENEITVNGQKVVQVLVNGKPFFDENGKIALENLPADLIDKIQISDFKTKEEIFTGSLAASNELTLNLTIDEEKNKGFFGNLASGTGTNDIYENSLFANWFKNNQTISVIGNLNNGLANSVDGNGIANTSNIEVSFNKTISKKIETNGGLNATNSENTNSKISSYETFLPNNFSKTNETGFSQDKSNG